MISASSAWVAAHRELLLPEMFIEIAYTVSEPGLQEDAEAMGTQDASFSQTADVVSTIEKSGEKYATLEHGLWGLDGSYSYFDSPANPGYVTWLISDAEGYFEASPKIILTFSMLHTMLIPGITIIWSNTYGEWAEEFKITAWADNQLVGETTVTGNSSAFTPVWVNLAGYNRLEIEIIKWSHPYHRARCAHISLGIKTVYSKEDLMGFEHSLVTYSSLAVSVLMSLFAGLIIYIMYGSQYESSVALLRILVWLTTFSYLGTIRDIWILSEDLQQYIYVINFFGAALNVVLNTLMIPIWGAAGAAIASVVTQIFTNFILCWIIKPLRPNGEIIIQSLNPKELFALINGKM